MNNITIRGSSEFITCKSIWFLFLTELNWNINAINPLDIISDSFGPGVTGLLIEAKYINQRSRWVTA